MAMGKGYRILHKLPPDRETPYSVLMDSKSVEDSLMFESGAVVVLTTDEAEPIRKQYTKVLDAYGCLGALCLHAGNEVLQYLVMVTSCLSVGKIGESEVFRITAVQFISLRNDATDEERIVEIRKLLSSGTFYFTWKAGGNAWDLSLCAQRKLQDHDTDNRFFWNRMLHVHFQRYGIDCSKWLLKAMCGGVEMRTIYAGHRQAKACLISRLSCERAGTRFNVRGANDDGNVANFVETEQVIFLEDQIASFVQTRGSIPLFWEQPGLQVGSHKVHMSRGYEMAAPAFDRHLRTIRSQYGDQVIVNLLGSREGEQMLSQAFMNHHSASSHKQDVPYYHFDYHSEIKGSLKNLEKLKSRIIKHMHNFGFFCTDGEKFTHQQTGTIRTNCLDCLDRTNATQTMIGMEVLHKQLDALGLLAKPQMVGRFEEVYRQIWVHNGDHISRIYTGTGALGGGRSKYSDASRSATRTIQNNFLDGSKQEAIDILLMGSSLHGELADRTRALLGARYLHASESILQSMTRQYRDYTKTETYRICVGTYNVNGGKHYRSIAYKHQSLADWLLDAHKTHPGILVDTIDYERPVDIFAIGFEEIVDLNASNIMSASTTNAREWQKEVIKTISRDHKYVILTSIQLVGVVLYVFVRPHLAPFIRDVAVEKVKTGLGGATGNKGGVGIRFLLNSSSICFVCAHLAAGQNQVNDRNADYTEITRKMSFPMSTDNRRKGRTILSHDYVFWCGDFNYRIDLSNEEVKSLVASENWGALQDMDQLNTQRAQNNTFQGFNEGRTDFAPTYKYDTFSDDYDTSEKSRTPAWTDRVLWKVKNGKDESKEEDQTPVRLLLYTRAELRTSDHRPVVALYDVDTLVVDEDKKNAKLNQVISEQGPPDGTVIVSTITGEELSDEAVNEIVEKFNQVGDIVIVRFVGAEMWVLYQQGQSALQALQFDQDDVAGCKIRVRLKTTEWRAEIEKELNLCSSNTGALYNQFSNSLLGDDFSVPSMEFDICGDEADDAADLEVENVLQAPLVPGTSSGTGTPTGQRSPVPVGEIPGGPPVSPARPARPPARPAASPVTTPSSSAQDGWSEMTVKEVQPQLRASPAPEARQPPARPSAPPAKPPPPQRPPGGPPRPSPSQMPVQSAPPSGPGGPTKPPPPKIRQPLRPPPSKNGRSKQPPKIGQIGLPTNVTHHGHASNIEEAQQLIQKLLSAGGSAEQNTDMAMPAPLIPSKSETNLSAAGNQLAPKAVPRSKTSQDIGEATPAQPQPAPRQRSLDNVSQPSSEPNPEPGAAIARPRPAPRRDAPGSQDDDNGQDEDDFTSLAKRPGVTPAPSRSAPPIPATRPAAGDPFSSSNSAPVPPARPSRPSDKPANPASVPDIPSSQPVGHLLDRENSMIEGGNQGPDPFDTAFAKCPPLLQTQTNSGWPVSSDPFDTTKVGNQQINLASDQLTSESSTDWPGTQNNPSTSSHIPDPFDTSNVTKPFNQSLDKNQAFDNSPSDPFIVTTTGYQAVNSSSSGMEGHAPDMSPPPLPPDMDPPSLMPQSSAPACPQEAPPPPPRVDSSSNPTSAAAPPPVPNRPGTAPPPVPKRPV